MKKLIPLLLLLVCVSGCKLLQPKTISIEKSDVLNNTNLVEATPDNYFEFIGLKNYSAVQIVDSMRAKQGSSITGNSALKACSAVMQNDLGFEYVSSSYVNPNYSYITVVESKKDYGIFEKPLPLDTLETIHKWNIEGKSLSNYSNKMALSFYLQFLRTDGNELSMKMKLIYNQFATDEEKEFTDGLIEHLNDLDTAEAIPLARKILKSDGNLVNRYWALLIMMRNTPTDDDLALLFDQFNYDDNSLRTYTTYVLRETLKLRDDINWSLYTNDLRNIVSGVAVWSYAELLAILGEHYSDQESVQQILNPSSPLLMDYLNAYQERMSKIAFNFVKKISFEEMESKKEASDWLTSQYEAILATNHQK